MNEEIDVISYVSDEFGITRDEHEHGPDRATRLLFYGIVWQAYLDLDAPDPAIKWDAQFYFHDEMFEDHATMIDLDSAQARKRLIDQGKLPATKPAPNPAYESAVG